MDACLSAQGFQAGTQEIAAIPVDHYDSYYRRRPKRQLLYYSVKGYSKAGMASIGEMLRRARLRRGWDLERVSKETKIGTRLLEAIEAEQFDRLPGGIFTRNFIRQYARTLDLDDYELHAELSKLHLDEPEPMPPEPEAPGAGSHQFRVSALSEFQERLQPDTSLTSFALMVLVVLACAGIYILWQHGRGPAAASASAGGRSRSIPAPAPVTSPVAHKAAEQIPPGEASQNTERNRAAQTPPNSVTGTVPSAPNGIHVVINAFDDAWVSASSDGERIYAGTLEPDQSKQLHAPEKMKIVLGNAGGVRIVMNGVPLGKLGLPGQVRVLELTPTTYTVGAPRTPPSSTAETEPPSAAVRR